jgi:hypothetical protein
MMIDKDQTTTSWTAKVMSHIKNVLSIFARVKYLNHGWINFIQKGVNMADIKSNCCLTKSTYGFCYKNLWHWYVFVATLPFFVGGVKFLVNFLQSVGSPAAAH